MHANPLQVRSLLPACSASIFCCPSPQKKYLDCHHRQGNNLYGPPPFPLQVYDSCRQHGVFPGLSQFNRLMDWYATSNRCGLAWASPMSLAGGYRSLGYG